MSTPKTRIVACPACGGESIYAASNAYRPFCSERCKNLDLGAWASEAYRVPSVAPPDTEADPDAGEPRH